MWTAANALPAYHKLDEEKDLQCTIAGEDTEKGECNPTVVPSINDRMLLAAAQAGAPINEQNTIAELPPNIVDLTVRGSDALSCALQSGDRISVYAAPRVFTNTEQIPFTLYPPEGLDPLVVTNALVLAAEPAADQCRVRLAIKDEQAQDIARVRSLVEFLLLLQQTSR
jgi:hypothetical protein